VLLTGRPFRRGDHRCGAGEVGLDVFS
jgi:hypothetical protein